MSTAPYIFTKLMKPVMAKLRADGFTSINYLDDILMTEDIWEKFRENVTATKNLLDSLGLLRNEEKRRLKLVHIRKFLGFVLDSADYSIYLPDSERENIKAMVSTLLGKSSSSIRDVA